MDCNSRSIVLALSTCICSFGALAGAVSLPAQTHNVTAPPPSSSPGFIENQGIVLPVHRFTLKLKPSEQLDALLVNRGDRVKAGQPLARISDPTLTARFVDLALRRNDYQELRDELQTQTLQLALDRADLQRVTERIDNLQKLEQAASDYSSTADTEALIDKKSEISDRIAMGTQREAQLQHRVELLKDMADASQRQLDSMQSEIEHSVVLAPFAGEIVDRLVDASRPPVEAVICELWDQSAYLVEVEILQHQLPAIRPGSSATVSLESGGSETVQGTVSYLEPGDLAPESLGHPRFKAMVAINHQVPWLRPGMQVTVKLRLENGK